VQHENELRRCRFEKGSYLSSFAIVAGSLMCYECLAKKANAENDRGEFTNGEYNQILNKVFEDMEAQNAETGKFVHWPLMLTSIQDGDAIKWCYYANIETPFTCS